MICQCDPPHTIGKMALNFSNNPNGTTFKRIIVFSFSSSVTPNAQESEDSGLSLSFTVLGTEAAKRISITSIGEQDHEKEMYDDHTKVLRQKALKSHGSSTPDFR